MQDKEYIAVLSQSLEKKIRILDLIIEKNKDCLLYTSDAADE